jgi:AAA+ superfamily predicted ATPase
MNDISKGMIFYGPPGTGKTFIIHEVAKYSGLSEIVEMKSGTDFIKSHFGTVQLDFQALHSRCELIPHLACCLIID